MAKKQTSLPKDHDRSFSGEVGFSRALPSHGKSGGTSKEGRRKAKIEQSKPLNRATSLGFSLTTESQKILQANSNRNYLIIQNKGLGKVFITFDVSAQADGLNSVEISPGGNLEMFVNCPTNDIHAVSDSTAIIAVIQGQKT